MKNTTSGFGNSEIPASRPLNTTEGHVFLTIGCLPDCLRFDCRLKQRSRKFDRTFNFDFILGSIRKFFKKNINLLKIYSEKASILMSLKNYMNFQF